MSAAQALQSGDVEGALAALQDEVRAAPADPKHRVFLFQLFAVLGQWDRALTQLNVVRDLDPDALMMGLTYQEVLTCEVFRQEVFTGKRSPMLLGEPDAWLAKAMEALRVSVSGDASAADALLQEAWEEAGVTSGQIVSQSGSDEPTTEDFEWIADADSRLGPILEAIVDGRYYWIPFHRIARIKFEKPTDLRDLVWLPANFTWSNGGQAVGMVPTRYSGSENHSDGELRLARKTEWQELSEGFYAGVGQRIFATDSNEYALLNVREVILETQGEGDPDSGDGDVADSE